MLVVQTTPKAWKRDPVVIIRQDGLHARGWELEYKRPIFDNKHDIAVMILRPQL